MDILVVGAGLTGATLARALAEKGHEIRLIEQREHLAGNCFDYFNDNEIDVHMYGTHIFHTQSAEVWHFASRFAEWYPYQHEVRAFIDGKQFYRGLVSDFNCRSLDLCSAQRI